ncbi:hypothetical protein AB6735_16370 [Mucilaginibacter sp. RCC_168]|uniref:hypothetical protein n=1 Tax=Mucilaginibacter sp. RCC_168 TaxID=3239221 RepID=UPI003526AEE7
MTNRIKAIAFALLNCYFIINVSAQDSEIKINYTINTNKNVDFNYEKNDLGSYTINLKFTNLINSSNAIEQHFTVKSYSGHFLTLSPQNKDQGVGFAYQYSYIRGKLNPKYNAGFVYLLPCKKHKKVMVADVAFVGARFLGKTTPEDWKVYFFYTPNEDTVTAVRKGLVVEVKDLYETEASADLAYKSNVNEIIVEHEDGTLATYRGFKKGSVVVKLGQTVLPGTTLGLNSKFSINYSFGITLLVTYLKSIDIESSRDTQNSKSLYGFVDPHFCTAENANTTLTAQQEYTEADTPEIVGKELTKKELKQLINKDGSGL